MNTFQVVISSDGEHSFAALLFEDPILTYMLSLMSDGFDDEPLLVIGFSAAGESADIGDTLLQRSNESSLESINIYRIDGNHAVELA